MPNRSKDETHFYQIKFSGQIDDDFITAYCPPGTTVERQGDIIVLSHVLNDQAGIIGLIRHLHNLGCIILAMDC